jgi:hypothetical protein
MKQVLGGPAYAGIKLWAYAQGKMTYVDIKIKHVSLYLLP